MDFSLKESLHSLIFVSKFKLVQQVKKVLTNLDLDGIFLAEEEAYEN